MGIQEFYTHKIAPAFYQRSDVTAIARSVLGKALCTCVDGVFTAGIITEAEAYAGRNDKACHAHMHRRTRRTEIMFSAGGVAYVYLCYGIHHLFNIVTNIEGMADAVLVRAVQPIEGVPDMQARRQYFKTDKKLTAGPGVLSQALGIRTNHYGISLQSDTIWLAETGVEVKDEEVQTSTRVGVDYAGDDAKKPWRFYIKNNPWVSKY